MKATRVFARKALPPGHQILTKGGLDLAVPEHKAKDSTGLSSVLQRNFLTHPVYLLSFVSMGSMDANKEVIW